MATITPGRHGVFTEAEKAELRTWRDKMRERDRAMEPERDATVVLAELRIAMGVASGLRSNGYERRSEAKRRAKLSPAVTGWAKFGEQQELLQATAQIRDAESEIRTLKRTISEWEGVAQRQHQARQARAARERQLEEAERKLAGLGL